MKSIKTMEVSKCGDYVFVEDMEGYWTAHKIYHIGEEGILCNDLKTYFEYTEIANAKSMVVKILEKIKEEI